MKTNELLLCGSGVLAYAHIGVLRALEECRVTFASICGSSTGALIAALQANGAASSGIQDLFLNRDPQRFKSAVWFGSRNGCDSRMYCPVVDLVPAAREFVRANGLEPKENLRIVCWDLLSEKPFVFAGKQYDLALALAASCAVPGISRPVRTGGKLLVDIATRDWQPESLCCKQSIVSVAAYDGDDVERLSQVDSWLKQRRHLLHVAEPTVTACADRIVIQTKLSAGSGCACKQGDAAREAVINAGYVAARAALE